MDYIGGFVCRPPPQEPSDVRDHPIRHSRPQVELHHVRIASSLLCHIPLRQRSLRHITLLSIHRIQKQIHHISTTLQTINKLSRVAILLRRTKKQWEIISHTRQHGFLGVLLLGKEVTLPGSHQSPHQQSSLDAIVILAAVIVVSIAIVCTVTLWFLEQQCKSGDRRTPVTPSAPPSIRDPPYNNMAAPHPSYSELQTQYSLLAGSMPGTLRYEEAPPPYSAVMETQPMIWQSSATATNQACITK
ncbi:uncharacterized protein [Periplaneta americana]|uniref:uncharacterized protein n=1 Tax=Periplaneta americana TaxID=6978 RepID=UPI0037E8DBC8